MRIENGLISQSFTRLPPECVADTFGFEGYTREQVASMAIMVCPMQFASYNYLSVPFHTREAEIGSKLVVRNYQLGDRSYSMPYWQITAKGVGPTGKISNEKYYLEILKSVFDKPVGSGTEPVGFYGYEHAVLERQISDNLLNAGYPAGIVIGGIQLDSERLKIFLSKIWKDKGFNDGEILVEQIRKIDRNGDTPGILVRHLGCGIRTESVEFLDLARERVSLVFNLWKQMHERSFRDMCGYDGDLKRSFGNYTMRLGEIFLRMDNSNFNGYFPKDPRDTDFLGQVTDFEIPSSYRQTDSYIDRLGNLIS